VSSYSIGILGSNHNSVTLREYVAAKKYFQVAVEKRGDGIDYSWLGSVHYQLGEYVAAKKYFQVAVEKRGDGFDYSWLGMAHCQLGEYVAAKKYFQVAVEKRGDGSDYHWLGTTHYELSEFVAAKTHLQAAVEKRGAGIDYYWLGRTHYQLGEYGAAIKRFQVTVQKDGFPGDYFWRGQTYQALKQPEQAKQDWQQALLVEGTIASNYYHQGRSHYALEQYAKALERFTQAINDKAPASASALARKYYWRGCTQAALGQQGLAMGDYTIASHWPTTLEGKLAKQEMLNVSNEVKLLTVDDEGSQQSPVPLSINSASSAVAAPVTSTQVIASGLFQSPKQGSEMDTVNNHSEKSSAFTEAGEAGLLSTSLNTNIT